MNHLEMSDVTQGAVAYDTSSREPPKPPVVGRYLLFPDLTGSRLAEGGRRTCGFIKESKSDYPLVSIITVSLNSAATIEATIRSVLEQDYPNIEFIVVDGKSGDGTQDILKRFEQKIDYFISEADHGLYAAMNKGLAIARGDYILILNSDDWYTYDCVRSLLDGKIKTGTDFVSGRARTVDAAGEVVDEIRSVPFDAAVRLRMPLRHETMLIHRALYDRVGPYETTFRIISDLRLTIRLFSAGFTHHEIQRTVLNFRNSGISSRNMPLLYAERKILMREQFPFLLPEEVDLLAHHGQLSPSGLDILVKRYSNDATLMHALYCYVLDQQSAGSRRWRGYNTESLSTKPFVARSAKKIRVSDNSLRVATLTSMDHGGAGTGTQRRVEALRSAGLDATIHSLVVKSNKPYVYRVLPKAFALDDRDQMQIWREVRARAILPAREIPGFRATELFSLPEAVLRTSDINSVIDEADVVHMHWVVGMLDYDSMPEKLGTKPLIWTLADMNAFTGGCHYSEGCSGYKRECEKCPLLGGDSDVAHLAWKKKRAAYARLSHLHIVCPSKWMAECASASSLLGKRKIHYVPNAFPITRFVPTNKVVARIKLGLPMGRKFLLFGADSLDNKRKGGSQLISAIEALKASGEAHNIEILLFGSKSLGLPIKSHSLGHILDEKKLALIYSAADAFVFPSLEDNAPLTVGESLLCGTPVVASSVGNVPDLVRHLETGYIARNMDPTDLITGIRWALSADMSVAIKRSMASRMTAAAIHDPRQAAQRHIEIYRQAIHDINRP